MTGRQTAVETLRKTSDSLISCEGDLLSNPEEIQETVGEWASDPHLTLGTQDTAQASFCWEAQVGRPFRVTAMHPSLGTYGWLLIIYK